MHCYNCIGRSQGFSRRSAMGTVAQRSATNHGFRGLVKRPYTLLCPAVACSSYPTSGRCTGCVPYPPHTSNTACIRSAKHVFPASVKDVHYTRPHALALGDGQFPHRLYRIHSPQNPITPLRCKRTISHR